jgi:hypothetical protein
MPASLALLPIPGWHLRDSQVGAKERGHHRITTCSRYKHTSIHAYLRLTNPRIALPQASQAAALRELSKRERELALGQFVADGWLAAAPGRPGSYTLGVRCALACRLWRYAARGGIWGS